MSRQDATVGAGSRLRLGFEHNGAGAVAKQHAGSPVVPVEDAGERLGADHQRPLERASAQKTVGGGKREDKARTYRLQIECGPVVDPEAVLDGDSGGGKGIVRRRGREHDQVDRLRIDSGIGNRGACRMDRQMRGELALGGNVALPDTGALHDPLVGSVYPRRQFGIGQNLLWQIGTAAEYNRTYCGHETASGAVGAGGSALPSRLS